jgi:hypothetical protein
MVISGCLYNGIVLERVLVCHPTVARNISYDSVEIPFLSGKLRLDEDCVVQLRLSGTWGSLISPLIENQTLLTS